MTDSLQETIELADVASDMLMERCPLADGFIGALVYHDDDVWSHWIRYVEPGSSGQRIQLGFHMFIEPDMLKIPDRRVVRLVQDWTHENRRRVQNLWELMLDRDRYPDDPIADEQYSVQRWTVRKSFASIDASIVLEDNLGRSDLRPQAHRYTTNPYGIREG